MYKNKAHAIPLLIGITMIYNIYLTSQNQLLLKNFSIKLKNFLNLIENNIIKVKSQVKIKKYTVLRSPHVNKKSREQFEIRTYKRLIQIKTKNNKLMIKILNQLNFKLPQEILMNIVYKTML